jgi:hypothetical protein
MVTTTITTTITTTTVQVTTIIHHAHRSIVLITMVRAIDPITVLITV